MRLSKTNNQSIAAYIFDNPVSICGGEMILGMVFGAYTHHVLIQPHVSILILFMNIITILTMCLESQSKTDANSFSYLNIFSFPSLSVLFFILPVCLSLFSILFGGIFRSSGNFSKSSPRRSWNKRTGLFKFKGMDWRRGRWVCPRSWFRYTKRKSCQLWPIHIENQFNFRLIPILKFPCPAQCPSFPSIRWKWFWG